MKLISLFIIIFSCLAIQLKAVENSIVPLIDAIEQIDNIQRQKYTSSQYQEIELALANKEQKIRLVSWCDASHISDVVPILEEMQPDIICLQQLKGDLIIDYLTSLGEGFEFSGEKQGSLMNGFFYRKDRFEILDTKTWELPNAGANPEALVLVTFKDLKNTKEFALFNTHFTFFSADLRESQAHFVAEKIKTVQMPMILAGSLNLFANRPDLSKLPFHDGDYIYRIINRTLGDTKESAVLGHVGPIASYTNANDDGIPFTGTGTPGIIFDCIFASDDIRVLIHGTQPATIEGRFPSEHMPVLVDLLLD
jgi:endonuclease/exonuclease/phosphatase family metal-dependent hydrolase